jgi:hypothetical protein
MNCQNKIYNNSESGVNKFPIFGGFHFYQILERWVLLEKVSGFDSLSGFTCAPKKTRVYFQYPSSVT